MVLPLPVRYPPWRVRRGGWRALGGEKLLARQTSPALPQHSNSHPLLWFDQRTQTRKPVSLNVVFILTRSTATLRPAFLGAPLTFSVGADPVEILTSSSRLFGLPVKLFITFCHSSCKLQKSIWRKRKKCNLLTRVLVGGDNIPLFSNSA